VTGCLQREEIFPDTETPGYFNPLYVRENIVVSLDSASANGKNDKDDIVVTPGGPRPKGNVQAVGPGQTVRRMPDGTYSVISEELPKGSEGGADMADEQVLTPGGLRPQSQVHLIEPGAILDGTGGQHRMLDKTGKVLADFGTIAAKPAGRPLMPGNVVKPGSTLVPGALATATAKTPARVPSFGSGWITYASWTNSTGTPVSLFSTKWVVPPAPATQSGQTIFLFNGIQNSTMIYQPVLQWGGSAAGGGNYWAVASWYVDGQGGPAFHSNLVQVSPGTVLTGIMTLTGQSAAGFSYNSEFQGIANTGFPVTNIQELTWCIETLECYGITKCSDYPNTSKTQMYAINMETGKTHPVMTWTPATPVSDCGQHTLIFDEDSDGSGEVDLWYKASPFWTIGFGSIAPGTSQDWWFTWGGNGDAGPQLIQAEPLNASGELATTQIAESQASNGDLTYHATVQNNGSNTIYFQWRGGGR
jgi:hypothetical protein